MSTERQQTDGQSPGSPTRWAVPALLVLLLVIGLSPLWPVSRIAELFRELDQQDIAMAQAGDEVEINLLSVGMGVLAYTNDREPSHLKRMEAHRADLRQALAALERSSEGTEAAAMASMVADQADRFLATSRRLIQRTDELAEVSRANEDRAAELAERARDSIETQEAAGTAWGAAATDFERQLNSLMTDLGQYMARTQTVSRSRLNDRHEAILGALERLQQVSNTPNRDQLAQALSADYGDFHGRIVDQLDRVDALRATRGQFLEARRALDSVLDDELQPAIVEARAAKRANVTSLTTMTEWLQSGFTALAVVLAAAIGVYLVRSERGLQAKQRQLQQANRTKSDFLANMSHEIRTPMNAVLGMARLMERTELNSQQQDYLQKIRRSSENLLGIINDILDFSRIEADKLTLEDVSFELDEVLSDVANMAGLRAEEKGLELVYRIDPGVPLALRGDPLRLSQILLNLVNNAVKFTERGTVVISVACRQDDGDQVVLDVSVRDSGVGMSPEEQERLFQAFTQADTSTTRRFGGTGLGLAIVSHLVERMGGTVSIDSAPGEGTTFSFTLQLERAGDSPVSAQAADVPLNDRHALVVDDVAINREVLKDILQSWSFRVEEADSAEAAIEKEQEARRAGAPFSLILMDWKLPGLDGLAASERILSHHQDQRPLVLMVTAHDRGNLGQRADEVGIPAVLKKPFTPSTLYNAIASASGETVATAQARPAAEAQLPRFPGLRVLVAEDNAINSQVVEELLTEAGASVTLAGNGREAVEQLDNATFDAVLMDAQMPELDGYEATRQLRRDERHANLPIIAMTAHAMAGDRERCLEAGMNEYLSKPIDEAQLFNVLAQCVPASLVEWPGDAAPDDQPAPPPAQPTPPTDESPTRLPGIDLDQGLKRVGGKRELLHRQLRLFREQYADAPETLTHHLEQGDDEAAAAYAHALKGAAGVLGINAVADAAARVETACRDDAAEDARSALSAFTDALRTACESIDTGLPETPGHASSTNPSQGGSIQDAAPLCRDLLDKLKRNDLSAEASLTTLRDALTEHGVDDRLEALRTQIERLEFSQAQTTLTSLMRALGVEESSDD